MPTALTSLVVFGNSPSQGPASGGYDNGIGPLASYAGSSLLDSRNGYDPGQADSNPIYQWCYSGQFVTVDQVPSTISAVNIAASQTPVAGTPLTLVSTTGAGITVGVTAINRVTGASVSNLLAIDGAAGIVTFAAAASGSQIMQAYDPTKAIARNVRITSVGVDTGATFKVSGYDIYGTPMTETITGASATVASGKKAFKYISSIGPAGTLSGSAVTVGTGDVYGLPIRADSFFYQQIVWNNAGITATTGFVAAVTSTASSTTGDVRGTYNVQSASDGTKRLICFQTIPVANVGTSNGVSGVAQA